MNVYTYAMLHDRIFLCVFNSYIFIKISLSKVKSTFRQSCFFFLLLFFLSQIYKSFKLYTFTLYRKQIYYFIQYLTFLNSSYLYAVLSLYFYKVLNCIYRYICSFCHEKLQVLLYHVDITSKSKEIKIRKIKNKNIRILRGKQQKDFRYIKIRVGQILS